MHAVLLSLHTAGVGCEILHSPEHGMLSGFYWKPKQIWNNASGGALGAGLGLCVVVMA